MFAFIVLRGLLRLLKEQDLFVVLSCTGLVTGFGLQAFVNMASTLQLIPTKGMTLPFISYGGSSVLAVALGMGMLLALTRRRAIMATCHEGPGGASHRHRRRRHRRAFLPGRGAGRANCSRAGGAIALMTDARSGGLHSPVFAGREQFVCSGAGIAGRGALRGGAGGAGAGGRRRRRRGASWRGIDAAAVVGFGGYPCVAPVLGARLMRRRPTVILHEQNAVLGRANRFLARRADVLALSFAATERVPERRADGRHRQPGAAGDRRARRPCPTRRRPTRIRLLVLGGSLGARVFSDVVPAALAALPDGAARAAVGRAAVPRRGSGAGARRLCRGRHRGRAVAVLPRCRRSAWPPRIW